jgi:hypothetical protein
MIDCFNDSGRANGIVADRARYTWEHGLERNCPVHSRRKNTLMIFVGVSPLSESGSGNAYSCPLIVA